MKLSTGIFKRLLIFRTFIVRQGENTDSGREIERKQNIGETDDIVSGKTVTTNITETLRCNKEIRSNIKEKALQ